MKKVGYFISCRTKNTGLGGHYHSLVATAMVNNNFFNVEVFILGDKPCPTIEKSNLKFTRIHVSPNIISTFKKIKSLIKKKKIDLIHSFDLKSDFFARLISNSLKIPKINTKCGGRVPIRFFPKQHYLILYSAEDVRYFNSHKKFDKTQISHIPNRVLGVSQNDEERISELRKKSSADIIMLRISRISPYYELSLRQMIKLHDKLIDKGISIQTFIIGKLQDSELLESLKSTTINNDSIEFITNDYFTTRASGNIGVADLVVGTGRGFMEASSKGKVMLTPIKGQELPALVNETNFNSFFKSNFSERNSYQNFSDEDNLNKILKVVSNKDVREKFEKLNLKNFNLHFNIETKKDEYYQLYTNAKYKKEDYLDFTLTFISFVKNFNR